MSKMSKGQPARRISNGSMDGFLHTLLNEHNIVPSQVDIIQDNACIKDHLDPSRRSNFSEDCPSPVITRAKKAQEIDRSFSSTSSSSSSTQSAQDLRGFNQVLLTSENTRSEL